MTEQHPFKWRHFQSEIILLCVRWYLRYSLSYRDLEEIMLERGLHVDHTTIYRWVQRYAPELEKRCRPYLNVTTDSWQVDETYIKVKKQLGVSLSSGQFCRGTCGEFLAQSDQRCKSSTAILAQNPYCLSYQSEPRVINVDKNAAYPKAFNEAQRQKDTSLKHVNCGRSNTNSTISSNKTIASVY